MAQPITVGRIVNFVLGEEPGFDGSPVPAIRAAMIVRYFQGTTANLTVFLDGKYDQQLIGEMQSELLLLRVTSATEDPEGKRVGSWHWPPRV
jgi:hypothetical protein